MKITYRKYTDSDASQVNALALSAFDQYAYDYNDWDTFKKKISSMSQLAEASDLIVAEQNNKIVGAVVYMAPHELKSGFFNQEWAVIRMLVVSPQVRNQGIGSTLTNMCVEYAKRDKAEIIALHTSEIMEVALSMYLRMGFTFYSKVADIHGVEYAIYTMPINA